MSDETTPSEVFAIEFASLAREIAMDIFPLHDVLRLHQLTEEDWDRIQRSTKFQQMVADMTLDWNAALNTGERVKVKAATGLESQLEVLIRDIGDPNIPLGQRVEAAKFLARVGEVEGNSLVGGGGGSAFHITLNINGQKKAIAGDEAKVIEGEVADVDHV